MMELREETLTKIEDFLEAIPSRHTRRNYVNGIKRFEKWYGESIVTLIGKSREATKTLEKFYVYLRKDHPQNTCRNYVNGPTQFLKYFGTQINLRKSLGIYKTEKSTKYHRLQISEIQCMAQVSSLREQIVLAVWLLAFRISDAIRLKKADFDRLEEDAPIPIRIRARKEGTLYETFISQEFKDLLELYLPTIEGEWLFPGPTPDTHTKAKTLNRLLQKLAKRANIKLHGSLTWHSTRKLVMSQGAQLGLNVWIIKKLLGKSIPYTDDTYLDVELEEGFLKLHNVLRLKPTKVNNRVGDVEKTVGILKETLTSLEKENMVLKTRIDNLQSNIMKLEDRLDEIGDFAAHTVEFGRYTEEEKEALRRKYNIKEFSEEEKQLMHDYIEIAMDLQKEKGYLDEKDEEELKRRFAARFKEREKTKKKGNI